MFLNRAVLGRLVISSSSSNNFPSISSSSSTLLSCWMCRRNNYVLGGSHNNPTPGRAISSVPQLSSVYQRRRFEVMMPRIGDIRGFRSNQVTSYSWFTPRDDTTLWGKTLKKLGFTEIPKSILRRSGVLIYMKMADEVDYLKFFKVCGLPDTFASWFTVIELHVWLLCTRLMQDGREGRIVRNALIKAMWDDMDLKSKKLEGALSSARRRDIQDLNKQFLAMMISYDEGLLGDDYILAGALWRRFIRLESDPPTLLPEHFDSAENHRKIVDKVKALEMLVIYTRSQFVMLNRLSREQLLRKHAFDFSPFDDSLYDIVTKMEKSQVSSGAGGSAKKYETVKSR